MVGWGGEGTGWDEGGASDDPVSTGGDCGRVRGWEEGHGEEGSGDFMAEEGARGVAGKGEEEPDGFGEHSEGGGGEVHYFGPPALRGRKAMCWPGKRRVGNGTSSSALRVVAARQETERCIGMRWRSWSGARKLIWYTALEARHWFAAWTRPDREGSRSIQRRALVDMEAAMWPKAESTAVEGSEAEGTPRLTQMSSGLERRYPVRGWCS